MKTMKTYARAASLALTAGLAFAGSAQAGFIIDDWQIDAGSGNFVNATLVVNPAGPTARTATGGQSLPRADILTTITTGGEAAGISLGDCDTCQFGTFSNNVGTAGWGYWSWTGGGDLSAFTDVQFDYFSDLPDADVILGFFEAGILKASAQESDMAATGGLPVAFSLAINMSAATNIDEVRLYAFSEGGALNIPDLGIVNVGSAQSIGLDFGVRAVELTKIPEPATLALFGIGLAGLGFSRRKQQSVA
jgi:hypothetical protein